MKLFSVLLGCYGDFPNYSLRAIKSLTSEEDVKTHCDIHVGCNEVSMPTLGELRRLCDEGMVDTLIQSNPNINKDPMMRLLVSVTNTPYVLWLDDDSHMRAGWAAALTKFIEENHPLDVAGWLYESYRWPEYDAFVRQRPWWQGDKHISAGREDKVLFPVGGLFLARTTFLRQHNFPDRGMVKRVDDVLLGDLVDQVKGKMLTFSHGFGGLISVNDGERRGCGEGDDGWRQNEDSEVQI